jgi:uncharacterized protein YbjT (DUF2867 family)
MTMVVVFGGTGFLGRRLVRRLAAEGVTVRVAVRNPARARSALRDTALSRTTLLHGDVRDQTSVAAAIGSADAVVNTVSAYVERGGASFEAIHEHGARTVARQAAAAGVARLVLVSGIGADAESRSPYIRVRGRSELVVEHAFPGATIVRPGASCHLNSLCPAARRRAAGHPPQRTLARPSLMAPLSEPLTSGRPRLRKTFPRSDRT